MSEARVDTPTPAQEALRAAEDLVERGRLLEAIDHLGDANRRVPDSDVEIRLAQLRYEAFDSLEAASRHRSWPVPVETGPIGPPTVPQLGPTQLSGDAVRRAIASHGAVHVPGLLNADRVDSFVAGIQTSIQARTDRAEQPAGSAQAPDSWFSALPLPPDLGPVLGRKWVAAAGGMLAADAPRLLDMVLSTYEEIGLREVLTDYLGERPILSANKCTLREVPLTANADWHQDGAFLGSTGGIRALNVWIALTDCGTEAPGMDLVPRRFESVQETGTGGAIFDWAVGPDTVAALAAEHPVVRPEFKAGDALLFDDLYLHRSAIDEHMVRPRYAIESWFFAKTDYPEGQIPLVW